MKLLCIDGNSLLNRAFYGIKLLSTKEGQYTNAIFGFINILFKLLESEQPNCVAVAFDLKAPTFRHKEYAGYKAGRKPMPNELASQLPLMKEWLTLAGYHVIEKEGYEADDILGTLARICEENGDECVIATGDRDSFQLISDKTKVLLSATKAGHAEVVCMDKTALFEKYGLTPAQMIELKAIMGDTSDKIPGVMGIGEKGATDLVKNFSTLDNIYENIDSPLIKDSLRNKLINDKENAYLSRFLGTICRTVPIDEDINAYRINKRDDVSLSRLMTKLELFKQMKQMELSAQSAIEIDEAENAVSFKTVTANDFETGSVVDIFYCENNGCVAVASNESVTVFKEEDKELLENLLKNDCKKRIFDSKNFYKKFGTNIKNVCFDTTLAAYIENPSASEYTLERLSGEYGVPAPEFNVEDGETLKNAALLFGVNEKLVAALEKSNQLTLLEEIEVPLAKVLASMELYGVKVETQGLLEMGEELSYRIKDLEREIFESVGWEFNLNSPKQLGEALFERLMLPAKKKTSRGYSTSAEVLEELKNAHPAVEKLLEYRQLAKLKSTYCDALYNAVGNDGRIHSTFNQTETRTGRISSLEPNLQNIPVRREEGRRLRKFFTAEDGYVLCDADYSQIELRVLAAICEEPQMKEAFSSGVDIHTLTASQVFNMPIEMVTSSMRSKAKAVNFGIIYGIGAFSLSKDIGVTRKEADAYIKAYLEAYKGVDLYMKNVIEKAKNDGFVSTLFGRRRYLPELSNSNHMIRAFGERVARNAPIQGTAADIIKIAMIRVYNRIEKEKLDAKLILQVHDELIVECKEDIKDYVCNLLKEEMENAVSLSVKLDADVNCAKTWFDAKG